MSYYDDENLMLMRGDNSPEVKEMQADLIKLSYTVAGSDGLPDGDFGPKTLKAVKSFQDRLEVTGMVDHATALSIRGALTTSSVPVLDIEFIESPSSSSRKGCVVDMLVIHFTAGGTLQGCVDWFKNSANRVSAHYVLGKDGRAVQMVKHAEKAWHAGKSEWKGRSNCNGFSIGIEIVNWGELKKTGDKFYCWPGEFTQEYNGAQPVMAGGKYWEPYTDAQYDMLSQLSKSIIRRHSIPHSLVVGHSDIAPGRKTDPGPHFDWDRFKGAL